MIVTGCLGAKDGGAFVRDAHPKVLAVTGPHAAAEVMAAVHAHLPKPHDPFADLVPPQGIKLTPRHYAYLKISEGCNHRCTFCIIPAMRGDLVSRPIGEVLGEAETPARRRRARSSWSISQDTSAYGVDVRYRTGFWHGRPVKTRMTELATALDAMARAHGAWVRLHYVYPYPHVDDVIARMTADPAAGGLLPYLDVPFQHASPRILKLMKRPANAEGTLQRIEAWRARAPGPRASAARSSSAFPARPSASSTSCSRSSRRRSSIASAASRTRRSTARRPTRCPTRCPTTVKEERRARFMAVQARDQRARGSRSGSAGTMTVLVDGHEGDGTAIARSAADAPEIDGIVRIANGGRLAVGSFARVTVTAAGEHDLTAQVVRQPRRAGAMVDKPSLSR